MPFDLSPSIQNPLSVSTKRILQHPRRAVSAELASVQGFAYCLLRQITDAEVHEEVLWAPILIAKPPSLRIVFSVVRTPLPCN